MTGEPRVAVVVVTFHSAEVLPGLVASLPAALSGLDWDLVVADNASADETLAVLAGVAPTAHVVQMGRNAGYAAGVNAGVAAAGPRDAYLVLNPDVRLAPGSVAVLLGALSASGAGIAVPRLVDAAGRRIHSLRREPTVLRALAGALLGVERAGRLGWGEVVTADAAYGRSCRADWAEGSTQLVGAACAAAVGEWDESFFLYSEETDFHLRARDAGLGVRYVPDVVAQHLEGGSATSVVLWPLLVANRLLLHRKRHGLLAATALWLVLLAQEGSRALLGRAPSRRALRVLVSPGLLLARRGPEWLNAVA